MTTAVTTRSNRMGGFPAGLPAPAVDAAFVVGLGALGLLGFRSAYGGTAYLVVGVAGLALGVAATEVARRWNHPVLAEALVAVVVFLLLGGAIAARSNALAGIIPTPGSVRALGRVGIYGWKELLTTAPPVGNTAHLLAIPYVVGLIGGVLGGSLAWRTRVAVAPLAGPVLVLALGILFGARHPTALLLQGAVFAGLALAWAAARQQRARSLQDRRNPSASRLVTGAALLVVAAGLAQVLAPALPGSGTKRVVLSTYVTPPFQANDQPSPLAGFRQYAQGGSLYRTELFSVSGAAPGTLVRIATMDQYDGVVWGFGSAPASSRAASATDSFVHYGSQIPVSQPGRSTEVTVRVGALGGDWLPDVGQASRIVFHGPDGTRLSTGLRYNPATGTAAEPGGLQPGDSYQVDAVEPATPPAAELLSAGPGDASASVATVPSALQSRAGEWAGAASSPWSKLTNVELQMLKGFYSDGAKPPVLAGHSAGRLTDFVQGDSLVGANLVGDDEQYAATLALMADSLGVPARVVLGAVLPADGRVTGADVHAWVEVSLSGLGWVPIPTSAFETHHPFDKTPPSSSNQQSSLTPVQPPVVSALRSPLDAQLAGTAESAASRFAAAHRFHSGSNLAWLADAAVYAGIPLAVVALVAGAIYALKERRRRRRRWSPSTAAQVAGAWAELVDRARDLGMVVPAARTRREQADALGAGDALSLAGRADAAVFGPGDPSPDQAGEIWSAVDQLSRRLRAQQSRWRRWYATVSLRSLRLTEMGVAR